MANEQGNKQVNSYIERLKKERALMEKVLKDRLDFGFDSIYFRYAEVVEELAYYKEMEAIKMHDSGFNKKNWTNTKKMHFYNALEQLVNAHPTEEDK